MAREPVSQPLVALGDLFAETGRETIVEFFDLPGTPDNIFELWIVLSTRTGSRARAAGRRGRTAAPRNRVPQRPTSRR